MKTGFQLALSVATLSLAVACGPTTDPSKNNENNENNPTNNPTNNVNNPTNNSNNPTNNANNPTNNVNNPTNNTNNPVNNPTNNTTPTECMVNDVFFGQIDSESDVHAGGAPSTDPVATDAGLMAVMGAFDAMEGGTTDDLDLAVSGAIVTATNFGDGGNTNFWVEDANEAIQVFLGFDNPPTADTIKVGDAVSFTVTQMNNFGGTPQISMVSDFAIDSSGNEVPYTDLTGMVPTEANYARIVRIGGTLGAGERCGGSDERPAFCYPLSHDGQTIEYRSTSEFLETNDCVTYFGPLGSFPGPANDDGSAVTWQLNVANFSWSFTSFDN